MGLNIKDLQYFSDLFELSEAMQYAFNNEPKTDKEKENIKTACRKKMTKWQEFKSNEEMLDYLINKLNQ